MMTPYALTPLPVLLGIKTGTKVSIINPPPGFVQKLNPLPQGVEFLITARTGLDVILFFTQDASELVERLPALSRAMTVNGGIWVCWPKDAQKPLSEEFVRHAGLDIGMADDKICTFDERWTGLRLVWKQRLRPEKPEKRRSPTARA